ncbi:MAG TPA: ornithine carbamoyltransferase [Candidatus Omnitrophota bacterium]|nr:ornithine carbamoyltransferase [Candidatus Omnitrophota bacterium]HRZ15837.1 ornithine carbamoyltransferase [Candidatus Omnitrophota bacterium]
MNKDLITIRQLNVKEIDEIFALTARIKKTPGRFSRTLQGKSLAMIFQKPSNRTYVSFSVGMFELGGHALYLGPEHINLGVRETVADVARTLSRFVSGIVLRTFAHQTVLDMAEAASVPVINGLSDYSHPCQALADIFTIKERFGKVKGLTLAYVGDGNNVCNSLLYAASKLGLHMRVATPKGYEPDQELMRLVLESARATGARIELLRSPQDAARNADVLYTDVWTSMGQESEFKKRLRVFKTYQINARLVSLAKKTCLVMHCLPAHRGDEITDEVIDGKHSVVFDQAENRLHVQKAVLVKLLK